MRKISATVVFPVCVEIEVEDGFDVEETQEAIREQARKDFFNSEPIIHECEAEELID